MRARDGAARGRAGAAGLLAWVGFERRLCAESGLAILMGWRVGWRSGAGGGDGGLPLRRDVDRLRRAAGRPG